MYNSNKPAQEQVRPTIYIETEVVRFEGKHFLVCSVAETPSVKKSRARLSQDEPRGLTRYSLLAIYSLGLMAIPNVRYICCSLGLAVSATYTGRSTLSCILNSLVAFNVTLVTANPLALP